MAVYTLFGQAATGSTLTSDPNPYTLGIQFSVSTSGNTLTGIWFYSATGAGVLPQTIALYAVSGTSLVTSQAGSWKTTPGGSAATAGSGWAYAAFTTPPALTSGTSYKACVLQNTGANWYSNTANYWTTGGAGAGGITSGPVTAPNYTGSSPGQDSYNSGATLAYPGSANGATAPNYWIDPEVTSAGGPVTVNAGIPAATGIAGSPSFPPPPFTATTDAIPGRARPGYATPGNPLAPSAGLSVNAGIPQATGYAPAPPPPGGVPKDITVTVGPTTSRAQVNLISPVTADGKQAGNVQQDGKQAGPTLQDGKTAGPTTVDRRR